MGSYLLVLAQIFSHNQEMSTSLTSYSEYRRFYHYIYDDYYL